MTKQEIKTIHKKHAIEFLKWATELIANASNTGLKWQTRAVPQQPFGDCFIVINRSGYNILPEGKFLTHEELYEYWLKEQKGVTFEP